MPLELTSDELLALAAKVLDIESRAVEALRDRLDNDFAAACRLCLETPGRVVVTGMGGICSLGHDWKSVRENLLAGRSGVVIMPEWERLDGLVTRDFGREAQGGHHRLSLRLINPQRHGEP